MTTMAIILAGVVLLCGLLLLEKSSNRRALLPTKTALSGLFVLCAELQPRPDPTYFLMLAIALVCCLAGDILLALPGEKPFLMGLVAFLAGHIGYVAAFLHLAEPSPWGWVGAVVTAGTSGSIYVWLRPHLGKLHVPVVFYIIVITCMLSAAWFVLGSSRVAPGGQAMIFTGAVFFYSSDLFVARDRFLENLFVNRLLGLPLYYTAQFMIAFSVGVVVL